MKNTMYYYFIFDHQIGSNDLEELLKEYKNHCINYNKSFDISKIEKYLGSLDIGDELEFEDFENELINKYYYIFETESEELEKSYKQEYQSWFDLNSDYYNNLI